VANALDPLAPALSATGFVIARNSPGVQVLRQEEGIPSLPSDLPGMESRAHFYASQVHTLKVRL